tara:strand:- start:2487 stop:2834 length:348 start_codon:yes stop_codon:yes gene_type:complete
MKEDRIEAIEIMFYERLSTLFDGSYKGDKIIPSNAYLDEIDLFRGDVYRYIAKNQLKEIDIMELLNFFQSKGLRDDDEIDPKKSADYIISYEIDMLLAQWDDQKDIYDIDWDIYE